MSSTLDNAAVLLRRAEQRFSETIPQASKISVAAPAKGALSVAFELHGTPHAFMLNQHGGMWSVREWVISGKLQDGKRIDGLARPAFDSVVAEALGALRKPPRITVADMRCPKKKRLLFGKVIVQAPESDGPKNLIQVSCSWCKRDTGMLTFHYYDVEGNLVKTEQTDPYIRKEHGTWYDPPTTSEANEPSPEPNQPHLQEVTH